MRYEIDDTLKPEESCGIQSSKRLYAKIARQKLNNIAMIEGMDLPYNAMFRLQDPHDSAKESSRPCQ